MKYWLWLKKNWKWLLSALCTLGLSVLVVRARKAKDSATLADIKKKELEAVEKSSDILKDGTDEATKVFAETVKNSIEEAKRKTEIAENKREERIDELTRNSDEIDKTLRDLGVKELK